jgi:6-pyruvoyl-tetrahydropterin synthase
MNPRIEARLARTFAADHSLPGVGVTERHRHKYRVVCGYCHEIDAQTGCTRPMQDVEQEMDTVIDALSDQYLNNVLPVPPTAEMIACWILANLPVYWHFVVVHAYGGFECRVNRVDLAPEWINALQSRLVSARTKRRIEAAL